jgi:hypothetical protein
VREESRDDARQDSPDGQNVVEARLTGGDPRGLRNAGRVIDLASGQLERLDDLVQCVFSTAAAT